MNKLQPHPTIQAMVQKGTIFWEEAQPKMHRSNMFAATVAHDLTPGSVHIHATNILIG